MRDFLCSTKGLVVGADVEKGDIDRCSCSAPFVTIRLCPFHLRRYYRAMGHGRRGGIVVAIPTPNGRRRARREYSRKRERGMSAQKTGCYGRGTVGFPR